jgi:hypothetical protein
LKYLKERLVGATGSVSGVASILGSWQVCHNVCLGLIALLSIVGITLTGMPLSFLTKVAVPLWSVAVILLGITFYLYKRLGCVSKGLLVLNTGLITAGVPFFEKFQLAFWVLGGIIAVYGIFLLITTKKCGAKK